MRRGEVWWAEIAAPVGRRPVLLLSRNAAYAVRNAITVAEITTTIRNIPVEVPLDESDGLPKKCVVNLDTIMTIPKSCLKEVITSLEEDRLLEVKEAIEFALDL
jgi:mRNA interferase MazF